MVELLLKFVLTHSPVFLRTGWSGFLRTKNCFVCNTAQENRRHTPWVRNLGGTSKSVLAVWVS